MGTRTASNEFYAAMDAVERTIEMLQCEGLDALAIQAIFSVGNRMGRLANPAVTDWLEAKFAGEHEKFLNDLGLPYGPGPDTVVSV